MLRKVGIVVIVLLAALPAFADAQRAPITEAHPALHLMNNSEFALFLKRLDVGVIQWKAQLGNVDLKSLGLDHRESKELERSYDLCLQALDNTHEEIEKLTQKQTLKLDFLLLVDLNDLARNLDGLNRDLVDPVTLRERGAAQRSLGYARQVLGIDVALAPHMTEFQHHVLAFAGVIDATLDSSEQDEDHSQGQK